MSSGRTIWEMFTDWLGGPQELKHFNPLQARIGRSVTIDDVEWRDRDFILRELRVTKRTIEGKQFLFADYVLVERTTQGEETTLRIRLNPTADADRGGDEHHALLLYLEDELGYDEGFHDLLRDGSGEFRIEHDGQIEAEFTRLHGLREPYKAVVTVLADENKNRTIDRNEVTVERLEYWDFERDATDAAGQPETEYLFIEMNANDGWFQIWRGRAFDPRKITVV